MGIPNQEENELVLHKRKSNFNAISQRRKEEKEMGVKIQGGEIVNSDEIQSDSQEYADLSTLDKQAENSEDKCVQSRELLKKSSSRSKSTNSLIL